MAVQIDDPQSLARLLTDALSQDENLRNPAEAALSEYESRSGFCSCLLEIISAKDLENQSNVRWMASVYFKNIVNRYWRQRIISDKEKTYLRKKLLHLVREENHQVANQLATIVSKIARIDYPKEWQELFSNLLEQFLSSDILTSQRACMILQQTLKELSTKRLAIDHRNFEEITTQLFDYTWHQWCSDTQSILHEFSFVQSSEQKIFSLEWKETLQLTCDRWLLCLNAIRRMLTFGVPTDAKSVRMVPQVKSVCPLLLQAVQSVLQYCSVFEHVHDELRGFAEKACLKLMKALIAIQNMHPFSFSDQTILTPILEFCYRTITDPDAYVHSFDSFLIHCMIFVKSVLQCTEYRLSNHEHLGGAITRMQELKINFSQQAQNILENFMISERIVLLCKSLVQRYFILTSKDLDRWHTDPESFYHEENLVQWKEKLRPCAEALYLTIFEKYRQVMAPLIVEILKQVTSNCLPMEAGVMSDILLKDAVYAAVGYSHYELSNYLSFKTWFEGALSLDLHNISSNGRIIRRRLAWLLGQWVSEIKDDIKIHAYVALLTLLRDNDLAVKLAACKSLCILIEDVPLNHEHYVEFVPTLLELCFQSVQVLQEFDSKIQILYLLSVMIDQLGEKILPFAQHLIQFFLEVWDESTGENLMRIQVLLAVRNFVHALGHQSPMCYNMLLPILQTSIDVNNPEELNLLENGVLLWETTVNHAPLMIPQLLELFHYLVAMMERSFDHLPIAMKIIEAYILIGGEEFLHLHGTVVATLLDAVIGNVNHMGMMCTLPIIEMLIQCFPGAAPHLLEQVLEKLIIIFISGGVDIDPAKEAIGAYAGAILARLLIQSSNYFAYLTMKPSVLAAAQQAGITDQSVLLNLLDAWINKVDDVSFTRRKAYGLALCILLTLKEYQILERLEQILSVCSSILASDIEQDGNNASSEYDKGNPTPDFEQTKDFRKRQVESADPVKKISFGNTLRESLKTCAELHGNEAFNAAMSSLHPKFLGQLQLLLKA